MEANNVEQRQQGPILRKGDPVQVPKSHYAFNKYVDWKRWSSYWHQLTSITEINPTTILCIGIGDDLVPTILQRMGYEVSRFDFDSTLGADLTGDVRDLKSIVGENSFDVVLCCQVLEHLPYEYFRQTVEQLKTITIKRLIISLPYFHVPLFRLKATIMRTFSLDWQLILQKPWRAWKFDGEHYWEVGAREYSIGRVHADIANSENFAINRFLANENPFHIFWVLDRSHQANGTR